MKTPTQTRNVDIGHRMKTNDITGFLSYTMNIFSINTSEEPTESLSRWLHSFKHGKHNNVEATTKRWRKSTNTFPRFSWVSGYKITQLKTVIQSFLTWMRKDTTQMRSRSLPLSNSKQFLKRPALNNYKSKPYPRLQRPNSWNHNWLQHYLAWVQLVSMRLQRRRTSNNNMRFSGNFHQDMTLSTTFLTIPTRGTSILVTCFEECVMWMWKGRQSLEKYVKKTKDFSF